jgi:hypothetical protein
MSRGQRRKPAYIVDYESTGRIEMISEQELLLVLTICKLLGHSKNVKEVKDAYGYAFTELEKRRRFQAQNHPDAPEPW